VSAPEAAAGTPPAPLVFISWAEDCSRSDNIAARKGTQDRACPPSASVLRLRSASQVFARIGAHLRVGGHWHPPARTAPPTGPDLACGL
jgi:hypothetical protein